MSEPTDGMAKFKSTKEVLAAEILEVVPAGCYVKVLADAAAGTFVSVLRMFEPQMTARYFPQVGDYWLVYPDQYQAISPKAVFQAGYVLA